MMMSVGLRVGSMTSGLSIAHGLMSSTGRSNVASTGSVSMSVYGAGFGLVDYTLRLRSGGSACESSVWASDTAVRCGVGREVALQSRRLVVSVDRQAGSVTQGYSVDGGAVSAVGSRNAAATGATWLVVLGAGLGVPSTTTGVRLGQTACESSDWVSDTSVRCKHSQGGRMSLRALVTVHGGGRGSISAAFSYDRVQLSSARRGNAAASGSASVTIHGAGLGLAGNTLSVRYGETACERTVWGSETAVWCAVARRTGASQSVIVTAGGRAGSTTWAHSVDVGTVSNMQRANTASTGSTRVVVLGSGFGAASWSASLVVSSSACEQTSWTSDTSMLCQAVQGMMASGRVSVTAGRQVGSVTSAVSVDRVVVSVARRYNVAASGSASVTVHGQSMGVSVHSATVRLGGSVCWSTIWESDTSLQCRTGSMAMGSRRGIVTVGVRTGTVTGLLSVDTSEASVLQRGNGAATGSISVAVWGRNMGYSSYSSAARAGGSACERTTWTSDTSVGFLAGQGAMGSRLVVVSVGARTASVSSAYSIDVGRLSGIQRMNLPATGSASLTVAGAHLGLSSQSPVMGMGRTSCESTAWVSDTAVRCRAGQTKSVSSWATVTVGRRVGSVSAAVSADTVVMSTLQRPNRPATGSTSVTLHGSSLGLASFTAQGRLGPTACGGTLWTSESSLSCLATAGVMGSLRVLATAGGRLGSMTAAYTVDASLVSVVRRANMAATGSMSLTVHGANLGGLSASGSVRVGQTACVGSTWRSDTAVECKPSLVVGGSRAVVLSTSVLSGSATGVLSADAPVASMLPVRNVPTTGSVSVTVFGGSFGVADFTPGGRLGSSSASSTRWVSETCIVSLVMAGVGSTRRAVVTVGVGSGSASAALSFDRVVLLGGSNSRAGAGSSLLLAGANMGTFASSATSRIGYDQ